MSNLSSIDHPTPEIDITCTAHSPPTTVSLSVEYDHVSSSSSLTEDDDDVSSISSSTAAGSIILDENNDANYDDNNCHDMLLSQKRIMLSGLVYTANRSIAQLQFLMKKTARIWGPKHDQNLEISKTKSLIRRAELFIEYHDSNCLLKLHTPCAASIKNQLGLADRVAFFAMQVMSSLDRRIEQFQIILKKYQEKRHPDARMVTKSKSRVSPVGQQTNIPSYQALFAQQQYTLNLGLRSAAVIESQE